MPACSSDPDTPPPPPEELRRVQQAAESNPGDCDLGLPKQSLQQYAAMCKAAIGIDVPAFHCEDGTLVPENHLTPASGPYLNASTCDAPNVLNSKCDPGSKFQVLEQTDEAVIVAHCRHKGGAPDANGKNKFGDIAVIQYNKRSGATCFYQSAVLGDFASTPATIPESVPAPSDVAGSAAWGYWEDPAGTAAVKCVNCHDNGPFVRSPYLAQLRGDPKHRLPGTKEGTAGSFDYRFSWNKTEPYTFVGNAFQGWKAYAVSVQGPGSECTSCHRLGVSSLNGLWSTELGTALDFGLRSTRSTQTSKNPHSVDAPIWMKANQTTFNASSESNAQEVAKCAEQQVNFGNKPIASNRPPATCNLVQFAQGDTCFNPPIATVVNGETSGTPTTDRVELSVPLGASSDTTQGGNPGICYYTSLHGPFYQVSPAKLPPSNLKFDGSSITIVNENAQWVAKPFKGASSLPHAAPGGKIDCFPLRDFRKIVDPLTTYGLLRTTVEGDGFSALSQQSVSAAYPNYQWGMPLFGIAGNVAQFLNGTSGANSDFLKTDFSSGSAVFTQLHALTPPPPLVVGAFRATALAYGAPTDPNNWKPAMVVSDVFTTTDVQLLPANNTRARRCYITGLSGAWSTDSAGGTMQPSARIYVSPSTKDIRMEVKSGSVDPKFVAGAYASCVALDQ